MKKTIVQRIAELEKKVAELEKAAQPEKEKFVPEDSDGTRYSHTASSTVRPTTNRE